MNTTDFVERMDDFKAAAFSRRQRGPGGTIRRVTLTDRAPIVRGSWLYTVAAATAAWDTVRLDAVEDFRQIAFPERYEAWS